MKKHWFLASLLGAFGLLYLFLGITALVDGRPYAMFGKTRAVPMSPEVTIIAGLVFIAGAIYLGRVKAKKADPAARANARK